MSAEDMKEEMKKLKEELAAMREELKDIAQRRTERRGIYIDIGNGVKDYIGDVAESVARGIHGELEKSVFIGPKGVRIFRDRVPHIGEDEIEISYPEVAEVMSALGQEYRLRILGELMRGGKYVSELQEKLSEITTSTLSSHLDVLQKAGLVVQEKVRGRYLITMPGRVALEMARRVIRFLERGEQE